MCRTADAPTEGKVMEAEANGVGICLARVGGELAAVDNGCPHRQGPLGEGWIEDGAVVCPWHSWAFDVKTGVCAEQKAKVAVYPVRVEGEDVLVELA